MLWEDFRRRDDLQVIQRPTNQPWALEMKIHDPDHNVLWFGSESLKGVAFGAEPPTKFSLYSMLGVMKK